MTIELFQTGLLHGLILAIIAFGIMIPFRLLNFSDLTAEGAYPLGGAVCSAILTYGIHPILATLGAMLSAGIMGLCTSQITLRLKVNSLLSGIILSTMVYSINLRIMGKPNISLFNNAASNLGILDIIMILAICIIPLLLFLYTDFGLRFRATGINPNFAKRNDISINKHTNLGLFIAGSMFGLAGSLIVQIQQYMDIGMGVGIIIHALASLMIGEAIVGNNTIPKQLIAPIIGAILYQQIQGIALASGLAPSDLKFFTGSIILIVIFIQRSNEKL